MATIQTKISLRTDDLSNWLASNPVLNNGEIAIVNDENHNQLFKIGNGLSSFSQLAFFNENEIKSKNVIAEAITAKNIAQGLKASAVPLGLAAGAFLSANANFSQVFGFNAEIQNGHDYSFIWSGDDQRSLGDYYQSHAKGTFNINPADGISGFYIADQDLCSIINSQVSSKAEVQSLTAYYPKNETSSMSEIQTAINNLTSTYYPKSETSSKTEIESKINSVCSDISNDLYQEIQNRTNQDSYLSSAISSKIYVEDPAVSLSADTDLSVIKTSHDAFMSIVGDGSTDLCGNVLYIVSSDNENVYGQRIINLGDPEEDTDATTKSYVDQGDSDVLAAIPLSVSQLENDAGYLTQHQSLTAIQESLETLSTAINNKVYSGTISLSDDEDEESISVDLSSVDSLSVVKIDPTIYGKMLSAETYDKQTIYEIAYDGEWVAYGEKITNLADGESNSDACTVGQMNTAIAAAVGDINTILEALN